MSTISRTDARGGKLLERGDALAALHGAYSEARAGSGRIVFVSGEAGVGKTSLVRAFCEGLRGTRALEGACDPLFTPRPLGPFEEVAGQAGPELSLVVAGGSLHEISECVLRELDATPTVLVIEDVHWSDEATFDVLRMLGRRIANTSGLVIVTYRDDELDRTHGLRVLLGTFATAADVTRIRLEPLSEPAVAELADESAVDAARLFRVTGGNPFFVTQVLEAGGDEVPATLRDATLARAARLDAVAAAVLEAVAVAPPHAEPWLLEGLFGDVNGSVDDCLAVGLLVAVGDGVAFRHELARIAIEQELQPVRRRALHRQVLEVLERDSGRCDRARLAHHAEGAGSTEAVLRLAPVAAAEATARGAHREAAAQYARALRFADHLTPTERADLLERRSDALYMTDDQHESIAVVTEAIACHHAAGDIHREAAATGILVSRLICTASFDEATLAAERAVRLLEPLPRSPELARAYAALGALNLNTGDQDGAVLHGERAAAIARAFDDEVLLVDALTTAGAARLQLDGPEARATLDEAYRLALAHDVGVARILSNYLSVAVDHSDNAAAERYAALALDYYDERQLDMWRLNVLAILLELRIRQGRWDDALDIAAQLLDDPKESSGPRLGAVCAFARVRARRGDPAVHGEIENAAVAEWLPAIFDWVASIAVVRAEIAWLEGKPHEIAAVTARAVALDANGGDRWVRGELACWRRLAGIDGGDLGELPEPYALQLAGDALGAAEAWERLGWPYETALALSESDDHDALRRAHEIATGLGARPLAQRIARRLREAGLMVPRGPRAATRESTAGLTPRETEVLTLIADGLRNADIAARLHLSPRTVDRHVSSILRKLDASTRGEAAAAARRLELLPDA